MLQQNPRNHHSRLSHNHSHRSYSHHQPTTVAMPMPPPGEQSQSSDNDRSSGELRALDCNLTSLCDHIQSEGFNNGAFSDIVIHAMGSTYHLHRLVMSRSSYFRNMLHGPWKEATAPVVKLQLDDKNVNGEAIALTLAYLYGHHPKLNDNNAFRVLAAASFLDLEDLCAICTDFIISELWTSNFLTYQVFAENQDYGRYGDRVRNACWGYLCQCGSMELKEILPKLSSQTLHALLTSNDLWVLSEEKRFELALYTFLKKGKVEHQERCGASVEKGIGSDEDLTHTKGKNVMNSNGSRCPETDTAHVHPIACAECQPRTRSPSRVQPSPMTNPFSDTDDSRSSSSYVDMPGSLSVARQCCSGASIEGPSEETLCCQFSNCSWLTESDLRHCSFSNTSCDLFMASEWGSYDIRVPWGGRIVGRRQIKGYAGDNGMMTEEEFNTFNNIFEGGLLLYCNMSFEALLNARKLQEELGFPCKAVNDGLWLQMLLSQRVQEIAADTCKNCCLLGMACACRQPFAFSHGVATAGYYAQKPDQLSTPGNVGNLYVADSAQGEGNNNVVRPVRVHVRGSNDGLAVIGRAHTHVPGNAWPPTRFVFSRVPFGVGNNRNGQQSLANDDLDARGDQNADLSGDGLTALVGLSEGGRNMSIVHGGQTERDQEINLPNEMLVSAVAGPSGSQTGITEPPDDLVTESHWENSDNASISLDLKTPLSHFPPFRFGVEFQDVHRLSDGQVKHSPEAFYAGSLWKVSVQAFSDEDPQGRRTLGLFIHRRKAEIADPLRKVHMYVDSREKVTARYQLICPSKRDVMVFGSFKQAGTLLPKAPKGWGWRSALLYDELPDMLQNGCLRVSAVVQLV